jgi:P-type Mg2+ transporter
VIAWLSNAEAAARLRRFGPNEFAPPRRLAVLQELTRDLAKPLVLVLLLASAVAAAFGQFVSAALTAAMVVLSVALNFVQSYRSQQAAQRLRERVGPTATVERDGAIHDVPVRDVVHLAAGDLVPADARLREAKDLFLNEATLTGESLPREKHVAEGDAEGMVFRGTSVLSGVGVAVVTAIGSATQFGHVVAQLAGRPPETEFERGTRRFGLLILKIVVFLVLFVFLVNALLRREALESFLFAVALAVGLTPELLPMIVSVTLAAGAVRMARQKVIVKRLAAIENFGSMDVLCSDKTGTLTSGDTVLDRHLDPFGLVSERPFTLAYVNSSHQTGIKSPLDEAILKGGGVVINGYRKIDEIPFDFERRRLSVVVENSGGRLLITKGAPEGVIACCTAYEVDDGRAALDEAMRARCEATYQELSAQGSRVLAVAYAVVPLQAVYSARDERELVLAGFVTFFDPPMEGVAEALRALRRDGVVVKILTGDNELVAQHVCGQVGLDSARIVGGDEIERMTDSALAAVAEQATIFARVSPAQKNRIILALKSRNHVVGFLCDGINDAPSIHTADVGVSVATAVDVAKDAADIILLERDLDVLHAGILEGRRAFGNVMKYLLMGTSSNFGNMFSMAGAFLFLPFLPMLPTQILLNNFLYDLAQITIPTDNVDDAFIRTPQRWNIGIIQRFMVVIGPISSIYDFLTFGVLLWVFRASEALFQTGWFVESLATQTLVLFVIRTAGNPLRSRPSLPLAVTTVLVVLIGVILPFTPLAPTLGLVPLPGAYFVFLGGVTMTYLVLVELVKRRLMRKLLGIGPATRVAKSVTPAS